MPRKSELEEILEGSFKTPIFGLVVSFIFAGIGFYLSNKSASPGMAGVMTSGLYQMFGKFMYMLAGFTLFFSALGYIVGMIKKKRKTKFFSQKQTLFDLKRHTWREFEEFVGHFFERMGYEAEVSGGLNDEGIDLVVSKDGKSHFIQCKKYRERQVTLSMMRDFYGAMAAKGSREKGFFVTTGDVTLEAGKFAEENSIEVINGPRLMDYLNTYGLSAPDLVSKSKSSMIKQPSKICPECGASMVVRVARKGVHENKPFWGCSNYPKCRAIISYIE